MENVITTINFWTIDNVVQTVLANQERRESDKVEASKALVERKPAVRLQDGQGSAFTPVTTRRHVFNLEYNQPAESPPIKPVSGVSEKEDIRKLLLAAQSLLAQVGLPEEEIQSLKEALGEAKEVNQAPSGSPPTERKMKELEWNESRCLDTRIEERAYQPRHQEPPPRDLFITL